MARKPRAPRPALTLHVTLSEALVDAVSALARAVAKGAPQADAADPLPSVGTSTDIVDGPDATDSDDVDHGCDDEHDHDADAPIAAPRRVGFRVPRPKPKGSPK